MRYPAPAMPRLGHGTHHLHRAPANRHGGNLPVFTPCVPSQILVPENGPPGLVIYMNGSALANGPPKRPRLISWLTAEAASHIKARMILAALLQPLVSVHFVGLCCRRSSHARALGIEPRWLRPMRSRPHRGTEPRWVPPDSPASAHPRGKMERSDQMKDKPTAPRYRMTLPASGIGPMTYSPVDAKGKPYGKASRFAPASPADTSSNQELAEEPPTEEQPATTDKGKVYTPDPVKRKVKRRKTTLDKHLFNIVPPPPVEAFLRFEGNDAKWTQKEVVDRQTGEVDVEWRMQLHGRKPDLQGLRHRLINRLERRYKASGGYFLYRWKLEWGQYGTPKLFLHLIGDPGPSHTLEAVAAHLVPAWVELAELDDRQDLSLCWVQAAHGSSRKNFSSPLDMRLAGSLERLLGRRNEWGRVLIANIPEKPPHRVQATDAQLQAVCRIVRDHLNEYEVELRGATDAQAWSSWGRRKLLRMLSDANYGTVFLNEVTGPLVRQALGLE